MIYNSSGSQSGYVQVYGVNDCAPLTYIWNDEDFTLDHVIIKAAKMIGTVTSATMRLHAESGFKPAGVIATVVFNPSGQGWGAGGSDEIVTFGSSPSLSANTKYTVSLHAVGDAGNRLEWSRDSSLAYWASSDSGSTWDIDETGGLNFEIWGTVASAPTKATNPTPANSATVDFSDLTLSWDDGGGADTFNVYLGPQGSLSLISSAQAGTTKVVGTGDVPWGEDVYWRIDSTNGAGTTTGDTWSFTTLPEKVATPTPTDDQEDIEIAGVDRIKQLIWVAPAGEAPDYKVYFRASGGAWVLQETITDGSVSHTLSSDILDSLSYYSIYEWRVDSVGYGGTTTGDTWTFISQESPQYTDYTRRSDYDADKVWQPGTGWVDIDSFEYTGGGRFKGRVLVVGHKVLYFGDL